MQESANKDIQKKRMLRYFVEATQSIIEEEGIKNISIRKVGKRAGYNSSTLYNYFEDMDQLVLLASMKYLREYNIALSENIGEQEDPYQNFMEIWEFFCHYAFQRPLIFYNLFFSKYSNHLDSIIKQYYSLYPLDAEHYAEIVENMFTGQTILERNRNIMIPIVESGGFREECLNIANEIIISCFKDILDQMCSKPLEDTQEMEDRILKIIAFVMERGRG